MKAALLMCAFGLAACTAAPPPPLPEHAAAATTGAWKPARSRNPSLRSTFPFKRRS